MLVNRYQVLDLSFWKTLAFMYMKMLYSVIPVENITRYNTVRQVTISHAQLVMQTVSRSLTVFDSNLLNNSTKRATCHIKVCTSEGKASKLDTTAFMGSMQ